MISRRSILLLVYGVGARSDVTVGVWRGVEKLIGNVPSVPGFPGYFFNTCDERMPSTFMPATSGRGAEARIHPGCFTRR
jgi:hypothetical protein